MKNKNVRIFAMLSVLLMAFSILVPSIALASEYGTFSPDEYMTRAMWVTFLYRRVMPDKLESASIQFKDVDEDYWAYNAISWAAKEGIVKGMSENIFAPEMYISREQVASVLYRHTVQSGFSVDGKTDLNEFSDGGNVSGWAEEAVKWAISSGIITERDDDTLDPSGTVTISEYMRIIRQYTSIYTEIDKYTGEERQKSDSSHMTTEQNATYDAIDLMGKRIKDIIDIYGEDYVFPDFGIGGANLIFYEGNPYIFFFIPEDYKQKGINNEAVTTIKVSKNGIIDGNAAVGMTFDELSDEFGIDLEPVYYEGNFFDMNNMWASHLTLYDKYELWLFSESEGGYTVEADISVIR
ncbi:MAG: S-layer homology domain-containing protein [Sedimentibacter sp.]